MIRRVIFPALFLLLVFALYPEARQDTRKEQLRSRDRGIGRVESNWLTPLQSHAGPPVFSLDFSVTEEVEEYLAKMLAPEGIRWLEDSLERSELFRDFIQARIEEEGLPYEILYLPLIESTYKVDAVSRSGASGLWQFMENSIGPFDISMNDWLDERMDFWKATDAALKKLQDNYRVLGDWLLALGAYNCGLGKMSRVVQRTGIDDFWELARGGHLPYETAHYIPKYLSIVIACSNSGRNGIETSFAPPVFWDRVETARAVDIRMLAQEAGVPRELLEKGNAELKYGITPPAGSGYYLKFPLRYKESVLSALEREDREYLRFQFHELYSGDTLYDLSNHFGIPVSMIENHNPGIRASRLPIGEKILIPIVKEVGPYPREGDGGSSGENLVEFTGLFTVSAGDSMWSIAVEHGITPELLAAANDMTIKTVIQPGMVLKVPIR